MRDFELEFGADLEDLMASLSDLEAEGETGRQDVECGDLCDEKNCFPLLQRAIREAIRLANSAASRLEAAIKPGASGADTAFTVQTFKTFFCHGPLFPVPWAGNQPSGASVAKRFRAVAHELGPGRRIRFSCEPTIDCGGDGCCNGHRFAFTLNDDHFTIFLCARFWDARSTKELGGNPLTGFDDPRVQLVNEHFPRLPEDDRRAGIIIHEVMHLLFDVGDQDDPRRFDAHCYTAFALRVNRLGDDPHAVRQCQHFPCR